MIITVRVFIAFLLIGIYARGVSAEADPPGIYRWGKERDNANYLILRDGGQYFELVRSSTAVNMKVEPFNTLACKGRWNVKGQVIELTPTANDVETSRASGECLFRKLNIARVKGVTMLKPVFGADWPPSALKGLPRMLQSCPEMEALLRAVRIKERSASRVVSLEELF